MRRALAALAVLALAGCSAGASQVGGRPSSPAGAAPSPRTPSRYLGVAGDPAAFTAATGAAVNMAEQYEDFGGGFTPPARASVLGLLNIESTDPPAAVTAGRDDPWLRWLGRAIAAYRKPVAVSIDPEGNGPWYSYGTAKATAAQYIAAYRHVEAVLKAGGARNVTWVWTISNSPPITHQVLLRSLYPGDAWVQVVGVDGYFVGSEDSWSQVFARVFAEVRQFTGRPFLIAETSVQPGPRAAQWVRELFAGVESTPGVLGFVWFDYDKAAVNRDDWRIEDDPAALAAFRAAVKEYGQ